MIAFWYIVYMQLHDYRAIHRLQNLLKQKKMALLPVNICSYLVKLLLTFKHCPCSMFRNMSRKQNVAIDMIVKLENRSWGEKVINFKHFSSQHVAGGWHKYFRKIFHAFWVPTIRQLLVAIINQGSKFCLLHSSLSVSWGSPEAEWWYFHCEMT